MVKKGKSTMKIRGYEVNLKEKHAIAFDFDGVIGMMEVFMMELMLMF